MHKRLRRLYLRYLRPHLHGDLARQRVKLLYFGWHYLPLLTWRWMPRRLALLWAFLKLEWSLPAAHSASEIMVIARAFQHLPSGNVIEAGCWMGASTAKLSLLCDRFNRSLHVYDSFEGVQPHAYDGNEINFAGAYAATLDRVKQNVARFGVIERCTFYQGWFSDTLAVTPAEAIALAYIDCDVAEGTRDALTGILQTLTEGGIVFSQDYHLAPVRRLLHDDSLWTALNIAPPRITPLVRNVASLTW